MSNKNEKPISIRKVSGFIKKHKDAIREGLELNKDHYGLYVVDLDEENN